MKATDALKHAVLQRSDELTSDGYHQTVMNIMYEHWQTQDAMSYNDILNWFETTYGCLAKFAVLIGKYNQQVCNGGHIQYFHNGYANGEGGFMSDHDPSSPLHSELISLYQRADIGDDELLHEVYSILQDFEIELDEEDEIDNLSYLNDLDRRYFHITDPFMNRLEHYFEMKILEDNDE